MSRNPQSFRPAYAVVRIDGPFDPSMSPESIESRITIKKVVSTEQEAEAEVERLNTLLRELPPDRRPEDHVCFYFAQYTRLFDERSGDG